MVIPSTRGERNEATLHYSIMAIVRLWLRAARRMIYSGNTTAELDNSFHAELAPWADQSLWHKVMVKSETSDGVL